MDYEILIAESREQLAWLNRKKAFYQMLYSYAVQGQPGISSVEDGVQRQDWITANYHLKELLTNLVTQGIINANQHDLGALLPSFQKTAAQKTKDSTLRCLSILRSILNLSCNGNFARLNVSQITSGPTLGKLLKRNQEVLIRNNIAFPTFPTKYPPGTGVVKTMTDYVSDTAALIGYHCYLAKKTGTGRSSQSAKPKHSKPTNQQAERIRLGLGPKEGHSFQGIQLGNNGARISFRRTLRVPDNGENHHLPADLGILPIHRIEDYADTVPADWLEEGGLFIPLYQKEALFLQLEGHQWTPSVAKVCVGRINALTGGAFNERIHEHRQDYVVIPHQRWLDGINLGNGLVRQFVAMPLGQGYTIEAQITDEETFGGFQLVFYPAKEGRFPDRDPEVDCRIKTPEKQARTQKPAKEASPTSSTPPPKSPGDDLAHSTTLFNPGSRPIRPMLSSGLAEKAGVDAPADMGIAAGGTIQQQIFKDIFGPATWDSTCRRLLTIRLVNSRAYEMITGQKPPPSPITFEHYQTAGFPWYSFFNEEIESIPGSKELGRIQSVEAIERRRGIGDGIKPPNPISPGASTPPRVIRTPQVSELANELRAQARRAVERRDWKHALRDISMVISMNQNATADDYVLRSKCNKNIRRFKEAFIDASLALQADPTCHDALIARAESRVALEDYEGAEEDAKLLASNSATERIGLTLQAEVLLIRKQFTAAVYASLSAHKLYPDDPKLKLLLENARRESIKEARKWSI